MGGQRGAEAEKGTTGYKIGGHLNQGIVIRETR